MATQPKAKGRPPKATSAAKAALTDKTYRLMDDRSGEAFLLKTGNNKRLLIFDESRGINRAIRHCPNEQSIYLDEQSDHALIEPIIFEHGQLEVKFTEQTTQAFLTAHPDNKANGGSWFEEVNEEAEADNEIEYEELVQDIKFAIREKEKEEDGIHALEMVASVIAGSISKVSKMSRPELKRVIYSHAEDYPEYFLNDKDEVAIFDDTKMQRRYITLRALADGIIKRDVTGRKMLWGKEETVIVAAPPSIELTEYFADFLATDSGLVTVEEISKRS